MLCPHLTTIDYYEGLAAKTFTYPIPTARGVHVYNDGASPITVAIDGLTMTVPAGKELYDCFHASTTVTVTATTTYRLLVLA